MVTGRDDVTDDHPSLLIHPLDHQHLLTSPHWPTAQPIGAFSMLSSPTPQLCLYHPLSDDEHNSACQYPEPVATTPHPSTSSPSCPSFFLYLAETLPTILILIIATLSLLYLASNLLSPPSDSSAPSNLVLVDPRELTRLHRYKAHHPTWAALLTPEEQSNLTHAHHSLPSNSCSVLTGQEPGAWSLSPHLELRYNPTHCLLRRPTVSQARHCLRSQSLTFIGDSLTRYQYLSLIHFLHSGLWLEPLGSMPGQPNPVIEREHANWTAFYDTVKELGSDEVCTCRRDDSDVDRYERRHFHLIDDNITVRSSLSPVLDSVLAQLEEVSEELNSTHPRAHYTYDARFDDRGMGFALCGNSTSSTSLHPSCLYPPHFPYHPPTALIVNTGIWQANLTPKRHTNQPLFYSPIHDAIRSSIQSHPTLRAIWKTTTAQKGGGEAEPGAWQAQKAVFSNSSTWSVLDAYGVTDQSGVRRAYWDRWHVLPFVYEELNVAMLNMMCDEEWEWVSRADGVEGG
jgi:hypothetical protein